MTKSRTPPSSGIIGWREHIGLPDFGIATMDAKIDTGARTSALHAVDQEVVELDDQRWVEFTTPEQGQSTSERIRAAIIDERDIKNSGGVPERRFIVKTTLLLGRYQWQIELSLTNRARMRYDLILGRTGIRGKSFLVDSRRSYLLGAPEDVPAPSQD